MKWKQKNGNGAPALLINSFEFYIGRKLELEIRYRGKGGTVV